MRARAREFGKKWLKSQSSIFVRGLRRDCATMDVREQFNHYGVVVDIHIPRSRGEAREFVFV